MAELRRVTQAAADASLAKDTAIYDAWRTGGKWADIMESADLSKRGIQLALGRMRDRLGEDFQER